MCLVIGFVLLSTGFVFGNTYGKKITAYFYDIKVYLDGKPVAFSNEPFIYEGNTYVSLRDVSDALGINVYWDDRSKSIYMQSSSDSFNSTYQISSLQNTLKAKDKEIEKLSSSSYSSSNSGSLSKIESYLEDNKSRYTRGDSGTLRFDNFDLSRQSNDDIRIRMYGDFDRTSSAWRNRDSSKFYDFIEEICDRVREDYKTDMKVIVYDEDKDTAIEYTYKYSNRDLTKDYEY